MIEKIFLYLNTLRYLKMRQIVWRIFYKFYCPKPNFSKVPGLRDIKHVSFQFIPKISAKISNHAYRFLNRTIDIDNKNIWNDSKIDKLWLYHLHYFDSYDLDLIRRWIDENPPGRGVGWEPYPISLRIVNWIKFSLEGLTLPQQAIESLAVQTRYLRYCLEYHLLGNHLLTNAKTLIFSGLFFEGSEADRWFKKGMAIFNRELKEQILLNGAHFELSPMYHAIILEDILDICHLFKVYEIKIPSKWLEIIPKMFAWFQKMSFSNERLAFFNDTADYIAPKSDELIAYAKRLNLDFNAETTNKEGYHRLISGKNILIADVAPVGASYIPGHAHADSLSFELMRDGQMIFVNSGISTYENNLLRLKQRGTAAHNTVVIDGKNSSEIWQSFRMGWRAKIILVKHNSALTLKACHDGYSRWWRKLIHCRRWTLSENGLDILDTIKGKGIHQAQLFFHLIPNYVVQKVTNNAVELYDDASKKVVKINFKGVKSVVINRTKYYASFGSAEDNITIEATAKGKLPMAIETNILFVN